MAHALYLDCSNGASGDMIVAALLDLDARRGGDADRRLRAVLDSLPVADEFEVRVSRVSKAGLDACDFDVVLHGVENHDHDMAYLHGSLDGHAAGERDHEHEHGYGHGHDRGGGAHRHHHAHRNLGDVLAVIDAAQMTEGARELAHRAFEILASAEAAAHGLPVDQVHFHEVGAVDSIVDIISAAVLLDALAPARVFATPLPDGHGTVRCQHGVMPVPVPAVVNICAQQGLPFAHVDVAGELVTPTGAALIAAARASFELPSTYRMGAVGLGAGKRDYAVPSLVRAVAIDVAGESLAPDGAVPAGSVHRDAVYQLEADIDDAAPEALAYAAERLLDAGALEAHWIPVFTKKGRPAYQLQVIAAPADVARLEEVVLTETTTIGVRRHRCERAILPREEVPVDTPHGPVRVKTVTLPDGSRRSKPAFDDVAAAARAAGRPFPEVAREIVAAIE